MQELYAQYGQPTQTEQHGSPDSEADSATDEMDEDSGMDEGWNRVGESDMDEDWHPQHIEDIEDFEVPKLHMTHSSDTDGFWDMTASL